MNGTPLIEAYFDGELTDEQQAQLIAQLEADPQLRQQFAEFSYLNSRLHDAMPMQDIHGAAFEVRKPRAGVWKIGMRGGLAAAALIALAVTIGIVMFRPAQQVGSHATATPRIAMITDLEDAVFADPDVSVKLGGQIAAGPIRLNSGTLQLMFNSGAVVTLHGRSQLEMLGPDRCLLTEGLLTAYVPPKARGFVVRGLDGVRVVDLGTRFAMYVDQTGQTSVYVTQGMVRLETLREQVTLRVDESASVKHGGAIGPIGSAATLLAAAAADDMLNGYERWTAYRQAIEKDPSLLAFYDFTSIDDSTGRLIGAELAPGRWAQKPALRLHGSGSGNRMELPADVSAKMNFKGSFTVALWCRTDEFQTMWQTLIAKGDSAWRIHRLETSNTISFDTSHEGADTLEAMSRVDDGRWHHIVATYEAGEMAEKRLYIDGKLEAQQSFRWIDANTQPVWIGNNSEKNDRAFNGLIGEVAVFDRALSDTEIEQFYRVGRVEATLGNPTD
ncbi:hypothetical protein HED60_14875 [Planctomycetales bacterium ZRK34]|nr:hypothetical protein HED60_14875 [Planctomycetales bacterium ZRK34]